MFEFRARAIARRVLIAALLCGTIAVRGGDLSDALQATLRNHPAVSGKASEVDARRYAADGVRSQRYPTLSAEARQFTDSSRSVVEGDDLSHPALLRVRQPIWAFGRINNNIAVADAQVSRERVDLLRVRRQLLEDTAVAYAAIRGSQEHVEVARQNATEHESLLAQIRRRVEGQLASKADALLAATRLAQSRAALEHAIGRRDIARATLIALTQVEITADRPVPREALASAASTDLVTLAMDESAEIRLKQQQLGLADAEVDRANTSHLPTIYVQADKFYDQPGLRDDNQVSVVFEASLDGLGYAARGRRGEAAANRAAAAHDLAAAKVELKREIEQLDRSRRLQADLIELQTQSLNDLHALLASYQRQYESGTKSWLDLLNIQRETFEQQRQLVQAHNDGQIFALKLLARTGGLDALAGMGAQGDG